MKKLRETVLEVRYLILIAQKFLLKYRILSNIKKMSYQRRYLEEKTKITEIIKFECLSATSELYKVSRLILRELPEGDDTVLKNKSEEWLAVFSYHNAQLHELAGTRVCTFNPDKKSVYLGRVEYTAVSDAYSYEAIVVNLN